MKLLSSLADIAKQQGETILSELRSHISGLTSDEAQKRLITYGENAITTKKKLPIYIVFLQQFTSPLLIILFIATGFSIFLGEVIDATIIFLMILMSGVMNFIQEYHASKAVEKIQEKVRTHCAVLRDGKEVEIPITKVVIGDVVIVRSGDIIPADCRVLSVKDFFINESSLTGESYPIRKNELPLETTDNTLGSYTNLLFCGSHVISGSATAVVIKTGKETQIGKIATSINKTPEQNEFYNGIQKLSKLLLRTTAVFVTVLFLTQIFWRQESIITALTFAVAIAVGITPELLPVILSIGMAKGSVDMAKKGVIVKKLSAIPTIGSMTILCSDKTGTLTKDHIEVVEYTDINGKDSETVFHHGYINSFFQTGIKNPLDEAVLAYKSLHHKEYTKLDEIPFDFERRCLSILTARGNKHVLITKGAPETIISRCSSVAVGTTTKNKTKTHEEKMYEQYHSLSSHGYRVIAVASRELASNRNNVSKHDEHELTFLGFISFFDPPKEGLKAILKDIRSMHIEIKIITGDNELVTQHISEKVGLTIKGILLGSEVDALTDVQLQQKAISTTIFARFSPEQKERVIRILRHSGEVVGYLGDGVNDAPSLTTADVGISVNNAVDIAKESADMILTHKSLQELKDGILEGRKILGNTMKYVYMAVSGNFGNTVSYLVATLFLPFAPMLPKQILLGNFLYDISQITIPSDTVDREYIERPRRWDIVTIQKFMIVFGLISSMFDIFIFYILYSVLRVTPIQFQTGWFLFAVATQILVLHVIRTKHIPFLKSMPSLPLMLSTFLMILVAWILPFTPVADYISLQRLPVQILLYLMGVILSYVFVVEFTKRWFFKMIDKK